MADHIEPFTLAIPQAELEALYRRIDATRWPEPEPVDDWSQGAPLAQVRALVEYWRTRYDWRACEARLNALGQFTTSIDGLGIHFLHVRSPREDALPLIITHGWPGSVREFLDVIPRLTNPENHGGRGEQAFHVVAPSLPGFGWSGKPAEAGWGVAHIARAWATLMERLGYERWIAQGGDWGAIVSAQIGAQAPKGCIAIHTNMPFAPPTAEALANPDEEARAALARLDYYQRQDSAYAQQQGTRPQTIGYSLVDSPVGLAAWIFEKMHRWTHNDGSPFDALSHDAILDNIMAYWLPGTGASAARLYWESFGGAMNAPEIALPVGVTTFPEEIVPTPRAWCEATYKNIIYWNAAERGGHFAAWEQPDIFARELRAFADLIR